MRMFTMLRTLTVVTIIATAVALTIALLPTDDPIEASHEVFVEELRGVPVAPGISLWVHVFVRPRFMGPPFGGGNSCDDATNQNEFSVFAGARTVADGGLTFHLNETQLGTLSSELTVNEVTTAVSAAIAPWNDVEAGYFSIGDPTTDTQPANDLTNVIGALNLVPPSALAAAWTWVDDASGVVIGADVFYSTRHDWGDFAPVCNEETDAFDLGAIGAHELGHTIALSHVGNEFATMADSAASGEVRKLTLTNGDELGFEAALLAGLSPPPPDDEPVDPWCEKHDPDHRKYADKCT